MLNDAMSYAAGTLHSDLMPGERSLWTGKPQQGIRFRASDALMIPFSLLWAGFAIFWESAVLIGGAPFFFGLWGIPFVLVGLYMIFGRFLVDAFLRSRTTYAVTGERILIRSGLLNSTLRTVNLKTLADMSIETKKDGRGTLTFGQPNPLTLWYGNAGLFNNGRYSPAMFEGIENAQTVYHLILRAQSDLK